jgi:hypothetical protein
MTMKFKDNEHEEFYNAMVARTNSQNDPYRQALFYALGVSDTLRSNVSYLYDFEERIIKPDGIHHGFQTHSTTRLTYLAFNLFNGGAPSAYSLSMDGKHDEAYTEAMYYTPAEIFCCGFAPWMLEAVKVRYPEYTKETALDAKFRKPKAEEL